MCKRVLTKTQLCDIFELCSMDGRRYYHRLRSDFFTDDALSRMGITAEEYNQATRGKPFTYDQTTRIINYFKITEDELKELV